jgi:hypothetical protein
VCLNPAAAAANPSHSLNLDPPQGVWKPTRGRSDRLSTPIAIEPVTN